MLQEVQFRYKYTKRLKMKRSKNERMQIITKRAGWLYSCQNRL